MPLQATSGAASYDAFGGGAAAVPQYIEEVFSTFLYTGTGSSQTITNDIDISGKGGLVWIKQRPDTNGHRLFDTNRGAGYVLSTNTTSAESLSTISLSAFTNSGFTVGTSGTTNASASTYASWTFRKQPKFFDVVTYTGTGSNTTIAHSLGSIPACIMVKRTDTTGAWQVYHRSLANTEYLVLNTTAAKATGATRWNSTTPTSTVFSLGTDATVNASGGTYVAYIFAHDAGGFGLTGTDNVISCGSYVGNDSTDGPIINLGYEPQWVMIKNTTTAGAGYDWLITDNMRGIPMSGDTPLLKANLSSAEDGASQGHAIEVTATGFQLKSPYGALNNSSNTYIYIAIRRGPMKVPTLGTSVFEPVAYTGTGTDNRIITSSITPDSVIPAQRNDTASKYWYDRLRGNGTYLVISGTNAEGTDGAVYGPQFNKVQTGYQQGTSDSGFLNSSTIPTTYVNYLLKRAPSFFDEVCYTGTGSSTTFSHNLAAVPELIIFKRRSAANPWMVYCNRYNGGVNANQYYQVLNATDSENSGSGLLNNTDPTSSVFTVGTWNENNASGSTYVAYLFATCVGVSKVGSYTGNGSTQTINCGFTGGARFVMVKATSTTGNWIVADSARGIVAGNDPALYLNSTAAEVTGLDWIDADNSGFIVNETATIAANTNGVSYIFFAVA